MYHLIHLVHGADLTTPVVASQVFDRAQVEASTPGHDKPQSVSVWSVYPLRLFLRDLFNQSLAHLRKRLPKDFPNVELRVYSGIGRFNYRPAISQLLARRKVLGEARVVYHCRSEITADWALALRAQHPQDAVVLDIRGYQPMERLAEKGFFDLSKASALDLSLYARDEERLRHWLQKADGISTVSAPLKEYLCNHLGAPPEMSVIPCCVKHLSDDSRREEVRRQLGFQERTALVYLGGTSVYQHLEDLVIPFMKAALNLSPQNIAVFLSQHRRAMQAMLERSGIDSSRVKLLSVDKDDVGPILSACDVGLLLRARSPLNQFSQPTKFGEYLAAGLPVVVEVGTGETEQLIKAHGLGTAVQLTGKNAAAAAAEVSKALTWLQTHGNAARSKARDFVATNYTWAAHLSTERQLYARSLAASRNRSSNS